MKPTSFWTTLEEVLEEVALKCKGRHKEHRGVQGSELGICIPTQGGNAILWFYGDENVSDVKNLN